MDLGSSLSNLGFEEAASEKWMAKKNGLLSSSLETRYFLRRSMYYSTLETDGILEVS